MLADPTVFVLGTFSFGDGEAQALMAEDGGCFAQVASRTAPSTYKLFPLGEGATEYRFARVDFDKLGTDEALRWLSPTLSKTLNLFDFETGFGGVEAQRDLWITTEPDSAALTRVHTAAGMVRSAVGDRQPFWAESRSNGGSIMTRAPSGEIQTLATGPWFPVSLAVSENRLVWLGAFGDRARDGQFDSAALYSCERDAKSGECEVQKGLSVPIRGATGTLVATPTRLALTGCDTERCDVYVVDLAASKIYRVRPREAELGLTVIGLSQARLIAGESSAKVRNTADFDGLRAYALDRIQEFAEAL